MTKESYYQKLLNKKVKTIVFLEEVAIKFKNVTRKS